MVSAELSELHDQLSRRFSGRHPRAAEGEWHRAVQGPESAENGKFAWVLDPDGNKVELWEPMLWDDKNKHNCAASAVSYAMDVVPWEVRD
jgi:hypothetical protein